MEELWKGHLQYIQLLPFTAYIQAWKPSSHAKGCKHKLRRMGVPALWFGIGQKLILPILWGGRIGASSHLEIAWTHLHSRMAPCLNYHVPLRHIHNTQKWNISLHSSYSWNIILRQCNLMKCHPQEIPWKREGGSIIRMSPVSLLP